MSWACLGVIELSRRLTAPDIHASTCCVTDVILVTYYRLGVRL